MAFAAEKSEIIYAYDLRTKGYAQGEITLKAASDGDYHLYFADDNGALDGYYEIATLSLKKGESGSVTFGEHTVLPAGAKYVIASFSSQSENASLSTAQAIYEISEGKRLGVTEDDRKYRFAALSDIHIDEQDGGKNIYFTDASDHFALALKRCDERDVDFVVSAGDQVTNASGTTLEWLEYQRILAESDFKNPVYEAIGNHETRYAKYSECAVSCGIEEFILATGLNDRVDTIKKGKPYFEITQKDTGDHFIFMALENGVSTNEIDNFSDEQMNWVESLLEEYTGDGRNIFLIQHSPISHYGAGDDREDPGYEGTIRLADDEGEPFVNNVRFKNMIEQYPDVIWLSGHSHIDFQDDVNYSDEDGTSCHMLHIPSVANTTRLTYDDEGNRTLDRTFYDDTTQGYLVDVYDGCTVFNGENFYDDKIYPLYSYIIGVPHNPELPSEPETQPETETLPEPTQSDPEPAFLYGDADMDGIVSVLDATHIQKYLATLEDMSEEQLVRAIVSGEKILSVIDATLIQKKLAHLIDFFPAEQGIAPSSALDRRTKAKGCLDAYRQYASYNEYQNLKKAYRENSDLSAALSSFDTLRSNVKITTVYFTDANKMGNVHAYLWNSATEKYIEAWPGQKPTWIKTNSYSQEVYALTVDVAKYNRVVFSDGGDLKTADIPLDDRSGRIYYPISDDSPYAVSSDVYEKMWYADADSTIEVYFTNTQDFKNVYCYYWNKNGNNGWPGKTMTFVRKSSTGKSIYKMTIPADASVIFSDGNSQTTDITAPASGFGYYPYSKNDDGKWLTVRYQY